MKLEAYVTFPKQVGDCVPGDTIHVDVDADYVSPFESDIREWVANELAELFGRSFGDDEFEITNLDQLMEDLNYEEYMEKTQYSNM